MGAEAGFARSIRQLAEVCTVAPPKVKKMEGFEEKLRMVQAVRAATLGEGTEQQANREDDNGGHLREVLRLQAQSEKLERKLLALGPQLAERRKHLADLTEVGEQLETAEFRFVRQQTRMLTALRAQRAARRR